jgi:hypothetical protein
MAFPLEIPKTSYLNQYTLFNSPTLNEVGPSSSSSPHVIMLTDEGLPIIVYEYLTQFKDLEKQVV